MVPKDRARAVGPVLAVPHEETLRIKLPAIRALSPSNPSAIDQFHGPYFIEEGYGVWEGYFQDPLYGHVVSNIQI